MANYSAVDGNKGFYDGRMLLEKLHADSRQKLIASNETLKNDVMELNKNGYLIIKNVLSKQKLVELRKESDRLLTDIPKNTKHKIFNTTSLTDRYYSIVSTSRAYDDLMLHERVKNILNYYLYKNYLLTVSMIINIKPGENLQNLHRDNNPFMYGPIEPLQNPLVISTMWAINDFTKENGATRFVPGSHKWKRDRSLTKNDKIVNATMPAGSVAIWFDSLLHGGGKNISNVSRTGALIIYNQPWIRPQENAMLSTPFEKVKSLPKEIQRLIGYSVHGAVGVYQGRHPIHAIDKILEKKAKL